MKILTLDQIDRLHPGETMIAYLGNLEYDIARCDKQSPTDKGAPLYKYMLNALQDELQRRVARKQIRLTRIEVKSQRTSNRGTVNDWRDFRYEVVKLTHD
jgi:hypothetical protein